MAGALKSHLLNLATVLGLWVGLAGCTTSPVSAPLVQLPEPVVVRVKSPPLPAAPAAYLPDVPELSVSPVESLPTVDSPSASETRPALLDGEVAREFERGGASWYGPGFYGRRTASGERYDMNALTAAHRTLPFGTMVRVHSLVNGQEVDVRINDRGPFSRNRVIDVSRAAAEQLGMLGLGFKEVVLLVPESTSLVAETWPVPVKKDRRTTKRAARPKLHGGRDLCASGHACNSS